MKYITSLFIATILIMQCASGLAYDTSNKNEGKVYTNKSVDTSIPSRFAPGESKDINDWLKILPYEEYKYHDQYMVIPGMGMITPIYSLDQSSDDYKKAKLGKAFDYDKYLIGGVMVYPGTAALGDTGNTFIFGHSNYWLNQPGKFKNIFRLTYNIEEGDSIYIYKKIEDKRKIYIYKIKKSLVVNEKDVWVMLPETKGAKELTLSSCRPIGTTKQRRINKAEIAYEGWLDTLLHLTTSKQQTITTPKLKKKALKTSSGGVSTGTTLN